MATRKKKWHPPPPPTPKILHFPRRTRRSKTTKLFAGKLLPEKEPECRREQRGKLETLFDQERSFSRTVPVVYFEDGECERRERVDDRENRACSGDIGEENWRFQAEFLRAECNLLRMEREVALKKLERNRLQMERALQSAVETLILGRKKIYEGKNAGILLEEEIQELEEKLEALQSRSGMRYLELRKCNNFDRQASVLRRRLEKFESFSEEKQCVREIRKMAEASLRIESSCRLEKPLISDSKIRFADVEIIRRKMEGLSKGMLERMEEYGCMLSATSSSSAASSASTSRRIEFLEAENRPTAKCTSGEENAVCSGRCKSIVRKIVEQARAETEQWSQMQEMLGQVREEMEELQASRDFWEDRALESDGRIQSLQCEVQEWRQKAQSSEKKGAELEKNKSELQIELERLGTEQRSKSSPRGQPNIRNMEPLRIRSSHRPLDSQKEKEKRVLICRLKETPQNSMWNEDTDEKRRECSSRTVPMRLPLQEIGNSSSPLLRHSRAVSPLYSLEP